MKNEKYLFLLVLLIVGGVALFSWWNTETPAPEAAVTVETPMNTTAETAERLTEQLASSDESMAVNGLTTDRDITRATAKEVPEYLTKSLRWMANAQFENGGWGAGRHQNQKNRDPKLVKIDPATTAFCAMALLRAGSTHREGDYHENVHNALTYLVSAVKETNRGAKNITKQKGTQPQRKLGENIDVAMTAQFFARILPYMHAEDADLKMRTEKSLDKCLAMLEHTQFADGSWNTSGWAPVLNSAMANNALELGERAGRKVNSDNLQRSRNYQASNFDVTSGTMKADRAAGVQLYATSSTQRATAADAKKVQNMLNLAVKEGKLSKDKMPTKFNDTYKILRSRLNLGDKEAKEYAQVYSSNKAAKEMLKDEAVLSGFGNNGGEEFLSYMMTAEALVEADDAEGWQEWHRLMNDRFAKIQNGNGSWSGHHCITSPVFCTAAVIMTLTADRDSEALYAVN